MFICIEDKGAETDATGDRIHSLTEAVMGIAASLARIEAALDGLPDSIIEKRIQKRIEQSIY